jgi:hypothetical protein
MVPAAGCADAQPAGLVDPVGDRAGRTQVGRLVVRRASWSARAAELPATPDDLAAWARERGLPRRVFARSPLQRKPRYVDFDSPCLLRTLVRFLAPAREQAPAARGEFTKMLPGPGDCRLAHDGRHYTSELRVVACAANASNSRSAAAGAAAAGASGKAWR